MNMAVRKKRKSQARRKPSPPPAFNGDFGASTPAATAGTVIEELKNDDGSNPNRMARRRRLSAIEVYHKRGFLSRDDMDVCLELLCAFEETMKSSPAIKKVQVDNSPKPDHAVEMQLKRIGKFHRAYKAVPKEIASAIDDVVLCGRPIERPSRGYKDCAMEHSKLLVAIDMMRGFVDE